MSNNQHKIIMRISKFKLLAVLGALLNVANSAPAFSSENMEEVLARSMEFAAQTSGCALIDGYRCQKNKEEDFLTAAGQSLMLSGNFLKAWQVAFADFANQKDQTLEQLKLKHYKIGFTESSDYYVILFQGLLLPVIETHEGKEVVVGLLRSTYGRTTKYWITKSDLRIDSKLFYK